MRQPLTLLFGLPRSGTTWLGKLFDSHPDTLYRHEPDSGGCLNEIPLFAPADSWNTYSQTVRAFVDALPTMNSSRVAGSLPIFPKTYLSLPRLMFQRFAVLASKVADSCSYPLPIPRVVDGTRGRTFHTVWKSIESMGRLGLITRAVPECRAILILRHPCAYVASVLKGESERQFTASEASSEDYEVLRWLLAAAPKNVTAPSLETLRRLHSVDRLAWRWVLSNAKALADISGAGNCTYVWYEDVCTHPESKTRELLHFAGLSWHPQVARFVAQSTSRHSNRYYSVFKDPLVAATKWQTTLSGEDIERVMSIVDDSQYRALYGIDLERDVRHADALPSAKYRGKNAP
jgi:hypothetical protein